MEIFGNKNFLSEKNYSNMETSIETFIQSNMITNLILNRFKYEGFTRGEVNFIESVLTTEGYVAMIHIDGFSRPIFSSCNIENVNRYGEPTVITAIPYLLNNQNTHINTYDSSLNLGKAGRGLNVQETPREDIVYNKQFKVGEEAVVIFNNSTKTSDSITIRSITENLSNLRNAYKVNTNANKTPLLFKGDKYLESSFKNVFNMISANVPYIFLKVSKDERKSIKGKETLTDNMESLNVAQNYIAPQLRTEFNMELSYGLNVLGIESFSSSKKERLITDEINQNSEFVTFQRQIALTERESGLERYNELFGTNYSVSLFRDSFDIDELGKEFAEDDTEE